MFSTEAEYGSAIKAKGGVSASMLGMAALPRVQGTDTKRDDYRAECAGGESRHPACLRTLTLFTQKKLPIVS